MELTEIVYFLSIAENKSLLRASEELFISQSALSQFLAKLEKRMGSALFLREKESKQMRLTPAGELYYAGAKQILSIRNHTMDEINRLSEKEQLTIHLGTTGVRSLRFSARLLALLQEEEPMVLMDLQNNNSRTIGPQILSHSLDFALIALDYFDDSEVNKIVLHSEEVGLCIPEGHPFLQRVESLGFHPDEPLPISLLSNESLILPSEGSVLERVCSSYFDREHFVPEKSVKAYENSSLVIGVKSMRQIGITSSGYAKEEDCVVFRRLVHPACYDLGLVYRRGEKLSEIQQRFITLAKENRRYY